jgi:hypothetical protein
MKSFTSILFSLWLAVLTGCSLFVIQNEQKPRPYYRIWTGYKLSKIKDENFWQALNREIFSASIKAGRGHGLINIMVVLPPLKTNQMLPFEIEMSDYQSESLYNDIETSALGLQVTRNRWNYFDREKSTSTPTVLVTPQTKIEMNAAYDLIGEPIVWSTGFTTVQIYERKPAASDAFYLDELDHFIQSGRPAGIDGRIILVKPGYVLIWDHSPGRINGPAPAFNHSINVMSSTAEIYSNKLERNKFYSVY